MARAWHLSERKGRKRMRRVYLDYNATTPVAPEVLAAMLPYFSEEYGNANSIHAFGQHGRGAVEEARISVAELLGARPAEILFTSGGTESNNHAILGVVGAAPGERKHVITTAVEHNAALDPCRALEHRGVRLTVLPVNREGIVAPEDIRKAICPIAAEKGVLLHTDAVQAAGKVPVNVIRLGVHLLSISGHKIYGPKGAGALYARRGIRLDPLMFGGHHERDRRPGTENVAGIVGLGKAAKLAMNRLKEGGGHLCRLRDLLERGLLDRIPQARSNGSRVQRTPNTTNLTFPFVEGEAMVIALDLKGIACSTGAACSSGAVEPSHV